VFPLFAETGRGVEYILADEALGNESAVVEEISDAGSVPELLVHNKIDAKVLLIEGEELIDANFPGTLGAIFRRRREYEKEHFNHNHTHCALWNHHAVYSLMRYSS
jgi:uncharacterized C2H2 Zn-finger protein